MLITISRLFGAGGAAVAQRAAGALGFRVVDNEFIDEVAERVGLPREIVAEREERTPSFLDRLARTATASSPELFVPGEAVPELEEEKLVKVTRSLVEDLATEGRAVVVGRAAAAVLAQAPDALHVQLVAEKDFRIRTAAEGLGLTPQEAEHKLAEVDANRARYHREYYARDWRDPVHYHMVLNTGLLGFDGAAELIVARARTLGWSTD